MEVTKGNELVSSHVRPGIEDGSVATDAMEREGCASMTDSKPSSKKAPPAKRSSQRSKTGQDVGHVLKSVYQHAIDEDIPAEMLDLLSKLD